MVDLGKYAFEIYSVYGLGLCVLAALVWLPVKRARKLSSELARIEQKNAQNHAAKPAAKHDRL